MQVRTTHIAIAATVMAVATHCLPIQSLAIQLTTPFKVNPYSDPARYPDSELVYNPTDHEFLAVWTYGNYTSPQKFETFARRFDTNGNLLGNMFEVIHQQVWSEVEAHVTYNSINNQYLVTAGVHDQWEYTPTFRADGQLIAANGAPLGNPFVVSSAGTNPTTAYDSTLNHFLFVGEDYHRSQGLYSKILGPTGAASGTEFRLDRSIAAPNVIGVDNSVGAILYNEHRNEYINFRWQWWEQYTDQGPNKPLKFDYFIRLERQVLAPDGSLRGDPLTLGTYHSTEGASPFGYLQAAYDPTNRRYLVAYESFGDVRGLVVDESGSPFGPEQALFQGHPNQGTLSSINDVSLAFDPVHQLYLVTVVQDSQGVLGQLLDASGRRVDSPIPIATSNWVGSVTTVYSDGVNGFATSWSQGTSSPSYLITGDLFVRFAIIPETSTCALGLFGTLCLGVWRPRRRSSAVLRC
jgi:hypothetical protein